MSDTTVRQAALQGDYVRVALQIDKKWIVNRGVHQRALHSFRLKSHAIAYARAISFSNKIPLFVNDRTGQAMRQSSASLTYPTSLD